MIQRSYQVAVEEDVAAEEWADEEVNIHLFTLTVKLMSLCNSGLLWSVVLFILQIQMN